MVLTCCGGMVVTLETQCFESVNNVKCKRAAAYMLFYLNFVILL